MVLALNSPSRSAMSGAPCCEFEGLEGNSVRYVLWHDRLFKCKGDTVSAVVRMEWRGPEGLGGAVADGHGVEVVPVWCLQDVGALAAKAGVPCGIPAFSTARHAYKVRTPHDFHWCSAPQLPVRPVIHDAVIYGAPLARNGGWVKMDNYYLPFWSGSELILQDCPAPSQEAFALLRGAGQGCTISRTELRGITLEQLRLVDAYIQAECPRGRWRDVAPSSPAYGRPLKPQEVNLYHALQWLLLPATQAARCSYVEVVASHPQPPRWFVSHWWGEPISNFVACLTRHAQDRKLGPSTPYWVCAYANNQWDPAQELATDPARSSFKRAMDLADGTVTILDREAVTYSRIWCAYEIWVSLLDQNRVPACSKSPAAGSHLHRAGGESRGSRKSFFSLPLAPLAVRRPSAGPQPTQPYLYDIYTVPVRTDSGPGLRAVGLMDDMAVGGYALERKLKREAGFPLHLAEVAIDFEISKARSTVESDRRRILNTVARRDLDDATVAEDPSYESLNNTLRGRFAVAAWAMAVRAGLPMRRYAEAMVRGKLRRAHISLLSCREQFDASDLATLARALPCTLQHLRLDFPDCRKLDDASVEVLARRLPAGLERLTLDFYGCVRIGDAALQSLSQRFKHLGRLRELKLGFFRCDRLSDAGLAPLSCGLSALERMSSLHLQLQGCRRVSNAGAATLAAGLPGSLEALDLSFDYRGIGDAGVAALADGVGRCRLMSRLLLSAGGYGFVTPRELRCWRRRRFYVRAVEPQYEPIASPGAGAPADADELRTLIDELRDRAEEVCAHLGALPAQDLSDSAARLLASDADWCALQSALSRWLDEAPPTELLAVRRAIGDHPLRDLRAELESRFPKGARQYLHWLRAVLLQTRPGDLTPALAVLKKKFDSFAQHPDCCFFRLALETYAAWIQQPWLKADRHPCDATAADVRMLLSLLRRDDVGSGDGRPTALERCVSLPAPGKAAPKRPQPVRTFTAPTGLWKGVV